MQQEVCRFFRQKLEGLYLDEYEVSKSESGHKLNISGGTIGFHQKHNTFGGNAPPALSWLNQNSIVSEPMSKFNILHRQ